MDLPVITASTNGHSTTLHPRRKSRRVMIGGMPVGDGAPSSVQSMTKTTTAEALFESAMRHVKICEDFDFHDILISVKSTDVRLMIDAYRLVAERTDIPLHLGVTEAGTTRVGSIKSSVGIGALLSQGIGDTIRVSLTDEPEKEIEIGKEILRSLGLASRAVEIIACPTCGRLEIELFKV